MLRQWKCVVHGNRRMRVEGIQAGNRGTAHWRQCNPSQNSRCVEEHRDQPRCGQSIRTKRYRSWRRRFVRRTIRLAGIPGTSSRANRLLAIGNDTYKNNAWVHKQTRVGESQLAAWGIDRKTEQRSEEKKKDDAKQKGREEKEKIK